MMFDANLQGICNVVKHRAYAADVVDDFFQDSVDMLYIDSIHTYDAVLKHVENWWDKVPVGGIIAGHDYRPQFPGVQAAVELLSNTILFYSEHAIYPDTSWAFIK
jgi:hypothetical protein